MEEGKCPFTVAWVCFRFEYGKLKHIDFDSVNKLNISYNIIIISNIILHQFLKNVFCCLPLPYD